MLVTSATSAHPRRRYKRGEGERLRADILVAAKDLLAETGDEESVSVRAVAERVGVTTPSIYHHFADKAALIAAVCADVFAELDRRMEAAAAEETDPFVGLRARGEAYARFALEKPEHYRIVMMTLPRHGHDEFASHDLVAGATFTHLVDAVRACQEAGVFGTRRSAEDLARVLWSSVHGAVSLALAKPGIEGDDSLAFCLHAVEVAGVGLAVLDRVPDDDCVTGTDLVSRLGPAR